MTEKLRKERADIVDNVKFLTASDRAVSVVFGDEISLEVNTKVKMLAQELEKHPIEGMIEYSPAYSSLMVHYQPDVIRYRELVEELKDRIARMTPISEEEQIIKEVPILYGGELGPDLEYCAELEKVTPEELIRRHSEPIYYVYMLGFAPGHPYMARFEDPFGFKRRSEPRVNIPARSVVVQLNLSDLIPFDQPCGWNIIGSTPLELYDASKENPFLLNAGEWVKHVPVTKEEYDEIRRQVIAGTYQVKSYRKGQ
ncbi:MAG: 5-oxoprolinase subunit PxpB [Clostridiales bacterium]|nr:5-oxoprolinase subunit PxpB [Clostridiales bacterium]